MKYYKISEKDLTDLLKTDIWSSYGDSIGVDNWSGWGEELESFIYESLEYYSEDEIDEELKKYLYEGDTIENLTKQDRDDYLMDYGLDVLRDLRLKRYEEVK